MPSDISVIIPNYCDAHRMRPLLESIRLQPVQPDAVYVYDDGSPEPDIQLLKELQGEFGFELETGGCNQGIYVATQRLLARVKTTWVCSCPADDRLCPGVFPLVAQARERYPDAAVIFGDMDRIFEDGTYLTTLSARPWLQPGFVTPQRYMDDFLRKAPANFSLSGAMIHRTESFKRLTRPLAVFADCGAWDTPRSWALILEKGAVYLGEPVLQTSVRQHVFQPERTPDTPQGRMSLSQMLGSRFSAIFVVVRQTAIFMRQPENVRLFPEDFIRRWQIHYFGCALQEWAKMNIPYFSRCLWTCRRWRKRLLGD